MADLTTVGLSVTIAFCLLGSAFFSMSETAFMSANRNKLRSLAEEKGSRGAARVLRLLERPEELIATILVGNNIVNVGGATFATALALRLYPNNGLAIATGAMTLVVLVLGEVTPKSFATQKAEWVAVRVSSSMSFLEKALRPLSRSFTGLANLMIRMLGGTKLMTTPFFAEDEIKVLLDVGQEEGSIEEHEADYIEGIFAFTDKPVREVCRPFSEVNWVSPDDLMTEVLRKANETGHSRLPVLRQETMEILGMVYVKDLLFVGDEEMKKMPANFLVRPIARFAPATKVARAFKEMQRTGNHLGFVLEDEGYPIGLVSMEDLLEEIFGEISDEYEMARRRVTRARKAGRVVAPAEDAPPPTPKSTPLTEKPHEKS